MLNTTAITTTPKVDADRNAALAKFAKQAEAQAAKIALNQWVLPVEGYHLTARFGEYSGLWSHFHTGLDFAAPSGTPIHAAADGTVVYARVSASWGGRTIIQHSPTLKTAYGHQSTFLVTEGQVVKQGQVIGLSGTTGWSTGCHLHFTVNQNGVPVDPMNWF